MRRERGLGRVFGFFDLFSAEGKKYPEKPTFSKNQNTPPPSSGAGYHSIHHTTYRHNYGHYFTYMDDLHGTLVSPAEHAEEERRRNRGGKEE